MSIFNSSQLTAAVVAGQITQALKNHRAALEVLNDLFAWSSGLSAADLQGIGFSAADATALLSALNDAHAEYLIHTTGLPPGTYPQPASAYVYQASQTQVIGPN